MNMMTFDIELSIYFVVISLIVFTLCIEYKLFFLN